MRRPGLGLKPGIDHLVIGAADLTAGARHVENLLGVPLAPGGRHDHMGTHNRLLKLGPTCYLEVIAIDPEAPPPGRPRWFGLDLPETAARLAQGPSLLTWVIHGLAFSNLDPSLANRLGRPEPMRRGDLHWHLTVQPDGRLPAGGLLPALIEWDSPHHPAQRLPEVGCRLTRLRLIPPTPAPLSTHLQAMGCHHLVDLAFRDSAVSPALTAEIEAPAGPRRLTGPCSPWPSRGDHRTNENLTRR
jgi:hypothetical protein